MPDLSSTALRFVPLNALGPVLDDHGSVRRGFQDIRMNVRASGAGNEKARSLRLIGGVLDEYDGNSPFSGIGNGVDDMGKRFIRIPQGQFAPRGNNRSARQWRSGLFRTVSC